MASMALEAMSVADGHNERALATPCPFPQTYPLPSLPSLRHPPGLPESLSAIASAFTRPDYDQR